MIQLILYVIKNNYHIYSPLNSQRSYTIMALGRGEYPKLSTPLLGLTNLDIQQFRGP